MKDAIYNGGVEFGRCALKTEQTYKRWVAELRSISKRCKFVCLKEECGFSIVDENIRDAIILRTLPQKHSDSSASTEEPILRPNPFDLRINALNIQDNESDRSHGS
ncbi:hypothetical protein RF11_12055 [Thelohanellus kitauei]|uniref:Uncharacterized protein n=1 Tax=Thelohanellus kitauei TaxID=669202 RepID=A0A0C2MX81_THEKT|nr:hypothetical protein RF11_12055 [Thelohanellus kitauei]